MSFSIGSFDRAIDTRHDASESVVLRYRDALSFGGSQSEDGRFRELLACTSIAEGVQIFPLLEYRGVAIDILDESSRMYTGTLKSIDGCVTTARCLLEGLERIVFESGGNTGAALAAYTGRAGIESFCVFPAENVSLIESRFFAKGRSHLIAVEKPEMVREATQCVERVCGVVRVPKVDWRIAASEFIGCFILEQLIAGREYSHLVQSISAAFGPVGIYRVLERNRSRFGKLPSFVGVQQASNAAMVQAWKAGSSEIRTAEVRSTGDLLSRVMYDSTPQRYGTFEPLRNLLAQSGGHLATVDHAEFARYLSNHPDRGNPLDMFRRNGVEIAERDGGVVEKTGLMALAGTLKQIDAGEIPRGSRVLCCLTGGTNRPDGLAVPELFIKDLPSMAEELRNRWFRGDAVV